MIIDYDMTALLPSSTTSAAAMPVPSHLELSPTVLAIEDLANYDLTFNVFHLLFDGISISC
jgi:hypothetical protein